ncbi:leucine--tRNA ligase [Anaplasmataceae bacterium AB001_6]|nr:leucine--tRNA ligase [Anaplasmataceae bacterium AB001_6]
MQSSFTYDFNTIESTYFKKCNFIFDASDTKPKYYVLSMFPYPSGKLHMGHVRNYTIGDVIARYKRAKGYNVLHPIGWDAFGLPAENAALERNLSPNKWTYSNVETMKDQLKRFAFSYNWDKEIITCDPSYYKHEQEMFIKFYERGIAYRANAKVNWDPVDKTVLANEQVVNGKGWRSGAEVEQKDLSQWFVRITDYAEDLLSELDSLGEWPESVLSMQRKWIGKSEGVNIDFKILDHEEKITIFTTRPETIFGATFCAISVEHPIVSKLLGDIDVSIIEKNNQLQDLIGIKTGLFAQHPFKEDFNIPVYIADYVLNYGSMAVFGCPAHDDRDYRFATKYGLEVKSIIESEDKLPNITIDEEIIVNSDFLDGLICKEARNVCIQKLQDLELGKPVTNYKLKDWGVSRQRYWGCPIPMIHCTKCGIVPVPIADLPITLPEDDLIFGQGNPLDEHPDWKHTTCPKCGADALRDTDTLDTFFESSWYFLAFCSQDIKNIDFSKISDLMPVNYYIGGIEHAVMHLLYSRFFVRALSDCGYFNLKEPFQKLLTQGMVCHPTFKDANDKWLYPSEAANLDRTKFTIGRSEKMSKSKKNIVDPEDIIKKYGVDVVRIFMMSDNPPEGNMNWSDNGLEGVSRFINRIYRMVGEFIEKNGIEKCFDLTISEGNKEDIYNLGKILQELNINMEKSLFNKSIAKLYEIFNYLVKIDDVEVIRHFLRILILVLEPFAPSLAYKLWSDLTGEEFLLVSWPETSEYTSLCIEERVNIALQINGKVRKILKVQADIKEKEIIDLAKKELDKYITGKKIVKTIFIPRKILNIVL